MSIDAYAIHIGPFSIRFYALILLTGILTATWLSARRAPRRGLDPQHVWDGLIWVIIPALIGARIYHILTPQPSSGLTLQYYLQNPLQMLAIWNGGIGIYGGIAGGMLGAWFYIRRYKQPPFKWFDVIMPTVPLAQAIGRWGNFINHELYGAPTKLPWAIYIPPENRLQGYTQYETFHPLFLYESLLNLAAFGFILWVERRYRNQLHDGDLGLIYFMLYPLIRFLLDFVRLDSNGFGVITSAQLVSLAAFLIALAILLIRHRQPLTGSVTETKRSAK